jgi:hypothetical protein
MRNPRKTHFMKTLLALFVFTAGFLLIQAPVAAQAPAAASPETPATNNQTGQTRQVTLTLDAEEQALRFDLDAMQQSVSKLYEVVRIMACERAKIPAERCGRFLTPATIGVLVPAPPEAAPATPPTKTTNSAAPPEKTK